MAVLTVDIKSYWHSGAGKSAGSHLDALVATDQYGLPYLSGRSLKGQLRDAVYRARHFHWLDNDNEALPMETLLFGTPGFSQDEENPTPREDTRPGLLNVSNAYLNDAEREWLGHEKQTSLRKALFREIYSTKIDSTTGTAEDYSLRGIQVTVPLQLQASITASVSTGLDDEFSERQQQLLSNDRWRDVLKNCLPLIEAVGAQRTRGLGRAILKLKPE